ncbi:MAG: hypothetical protein NE328_01555 [Lentisphaeraceae bacterium]|nr:hypothetical protein [Lentisphaeraceae bacterium]
MEEIEIKKIVAKNLNEGLTLNEIHKLLSEDHKVKMTFMELRLLSSEIEDMDWSQFDPKKEEPEEDEATDSTEPQEVTGEVESGTQIEMHKVQRPGAMMSGSVVFLSGIKGEWMIDQFGSLDLGLEDDTQQPTEEDMEDFQITLRKKLQGE